MEPLKAALERLARAADRLAVSVEAREASFARREQDLSVALQEARNEQVRVAEVTDAVSDQLERIITRLETVLEPSAADGAGEGGVGEQQAFDGNAGVEPYSSNAV